MSLAMLYPQKTRFLHRKRPTIASLCPPTHSTMSLPTCFIIFTHFRPILLRFPQYCPCSIVSALGNIPRLAPSRFGRNRPLFSCGKLVAPQISAHWTLAAFSIFSNPLPPISIPQCPRHLVACSLPSERHPECLFLF